MIFIKSEATRAGAALVPAAASNSISERRSGGGGGGGASRGGEHVRHAHAREADEKVRRGVGDSPRSILIKGLGESRRDECESKF